MKREEDGSIDQIRQLLAYKRMDRPSSGYFDGVLSEFHRRQRATMLQPKPSLLQAWWEGFVETITFQPARVLRYAIAATGTVALTVFSLTMAFQTGPISVAQSKAVEKVIYAFTEKSSSQQPSVDQQIDALTLSATGYDPAEAKPQYVLSDRPAAYETTLAF